MTDNDNPIDQYMNQFEGWATETDRKRRMLTRDDRQYLKNEKRLKESAKHSVEHRIRKRVQGAIRDFAFMIETGNEDLIAQDALDAPIQPVAHSDFIHAALLFAYAHFDPSHKFEEGTDRTIDILEALVADGIKETVINGDYHDIESVDVDIDITGTPTWKERKAKSIAEEGIVPKISLTENQIGDDLIEEKLDQGEVVDILDEPDGDIIDKITPSE